MSPARIAALIVGVAVLALDGTAVIKLLIVPRASGRWMSMPIRAVRRVFTQMALLAHTYEGLDRVLAVSEPVALVLQLASWLAIAVFGFTLIDWGLWGGPFVAAFSEAGSSVFTLGFTLNHTTGGRAIDFVAAGTGLVLVALHIAYLPTLYNAYNRRETLVTLLESRAGAPAWGPSCSSATSSSPASPTCPSSSRSGSVGRRTWPRATPATHRCSTFARLGPRTPGS